MPEVEVSDDVQAINRVMEGETGASEPQIAEAELTQQNFNFTKSAFRSSALRIR